MIKTDLEASESVAAIFEFSNDFENSNGSIREKRQNAAVQVQDRYNRTADVLSGHASYRLKSTAMELHCHAGTGAGGRVTAGRAMPAAA